MSLTKVKGIVWDIADNWNSGTAADGDGTPSVSELSVLTTANTGSTTITSLDDGVAGQVLLLVINDANTTIDYLGTTLKGNYATDKLYQQGEALICIFDGSNWFCTEVLPLDSIQEISGPGAIDVTSEITEVTTTGGDAFTLADGREHQRKFIVMVSDGGIGTLTPSNLGNGTTITFDDVGDCAELLFVGSNWYFLGGTATLA